MYLLSWLNINCSWRYIGWSLKKGSEIQNNCHWWAASYWENALKTILHHWTIWLKTCPECSFYWPLQHNVYCVYQIWLPPQRNLLECISLGNMRDISNQYITQMALHYWNFTVSVNNGMPIDINHLVFICRYVQWGGGGRGRSKY